VCEEPDYRTLVIQALPQARCSAARTTLAMFSPLPSLAPDATPTAPLTTLPTTQQPNNPQNPQSSNKP